MSDVTVVGQPEADKKTSKVIEDGVEATVRMDQENSQCHWNDQAFDKGDQISLDGRNYECTFGCWVRIDG